MPVYVAHNLWSEQNCLALSSENCQQSHYGMACRSVSVKTAAVVGEATEILLQFTAVDEQIDINITNRMEIYDQKESMGMLAIACPRWIAGFVQQQKSLWIERTNELN